MLALVNKDDQIVGKAEKWEAHKKALLHRAFTVVLTYKNQYVVQDRKHPVFDHNYDLSFSSHQIYVEDELQDDLTAIFASLEREWNVGKSGLLIPPIKLGAIYYKAKDPMSEFSDHEIDYIYKADLSTLPDPNKKFAYGYFLADKKELISPTSSFSKNFAPWVHEMIKNKVF